MFCVNRLCVLNASRTCYVVFSLLYCLPPVVCVDVFSDECAALSRMSLHQPFITAHLCLWSNVSSPLLLSPSIPCFPILSSLSPSPLPLSVSYQVHKHMQHHVHMCMHAHTYTTGLSSSWLSDLFISCGFCSIFLSL